jgi:hypothetical protein
VITRHKSAFSGITKWNILKDSFEVFMNEFLHYEEQREDDLDNQNQQESPSKGAD